jgi:hypothetical protein
MVVNNAQNETAIVIRRDESCVVFVRFKAGKLRCERMDEISFRTQWTESPYKLPQTLERFQQHAASEGCTQEAMKGLEKLSARERNAISSLF